MIHLNIGQPDIQTPAKALDAIKSFDQNVLAYGPSEGLWRIARRCAILCQAQY